MPVNVVEVSRSPYARLRPVPLDCVEIVGGFWRRWVGEIAREAIWHQYRMLEESDRINRFRWAAGRISEKPLRSLFAFDDSDVYKWLEACGFYLAKSGEDELRGIVNNIVDDIVAAQEEDGYLFTEHHRAPERRWKNLTLDHELYCAGHLIQAAIALHRSVGEEKLFQSAVKLANLISDTFNSGGIKGVCGHPEIEMALIELYRETSEKRYLETAEFFINLRGRDSLRPSPEDRLNSTLYRMLGGASYFVDHAPIRELGEIVGHAVRALYLNCGVTDLYMETGEEALLDAMDRLWHSFVERKMYITGAAGSRYVSEAFGEDYELPNERAYAETCASIANFMWNWRMLLATGEARFADIMELALYNSILSGISLDGTRYFYMNPLASSGGYSRSPWFLCACCPPNVARLLTSLPGYFYSTSEKGLWVHLYGSSKAVVKLDGVEVVLRQETDYPWRGEVRLEVESEGPATFSIFLRIPGWCDEPRVKMDGRVYRPRPMKYVELRRKWDGKTIIKASFPMNVRMYASHPYLRDNIGKVALSRGPLIYCLESVDNRVDPRLVALERGTIFRERFRRELLGGVTTLSFSAWVIDSAGWSGRLYKSADSSLRARRKVRANAIPYYAWANRGDSVMTVWLPLIDYWRRVPPKKPGV
ncbi:Non-reducing end beta-L-arabinofuranosidase [Candidatus Calditenuaceae archaeon HR02]|nr:Non-reducing end beta-L-arabinofuranosidase [Candidatus Calditenuaceae archaeon HR02]